MLGGILWYYNVEHVEREIVMDSVLRWQDAPVGVDSKVIGVRMTDEEKERLEQLRRSMGLTSKAQVIRFALDMLEVASRPGRWAFDSPETFARETAEWPLIVGWYVQWVETGVRPARLTDEHIAAFVAAAGRVHPGAAADAADLSGEDDTTP